MNYNVGRQAAYWKSQRKRRHPSDPIIAAFAQPKLNFILKYTDLPSATDILDVGCGNGYFTYYLEGIGQTIGVDYATTMLKLNPCPRLIQGSAFNLPFSDSTFDLSICSNLLHHLSEPLTAVIEMSRVSKRYVGISEPNRNNPAMLALGLVKKEERQTLHFTGPFLRSLAEEAGLHVLACATMGFITPNRMPRPIATLAAQFNQPNPFGAYTVLVARCDR